MLPNRAQQKRVVDVVEQTFDVKFQNPVVIPATLSRHSDSIEGRFPGPIAIGVRQEYRGIMYLLPPAKSALYSGAASVMKVPIFLS